MKACKWQGRQQHSKLGVWARVKAGTTGEQRDTARFQLGTGQNRSEGQAD